MSIIPRTSPLNLQYRVCIVTGAFTPLGVIICKTLLKANALVLGIDTRACDPSLNAGLGTHFQSERWDGEDEGGMVERVGRAVGEKFGVERRVDVVVNVVEMEKGVEVEGLSAGLAEVMAREGRGVVVSVVGDVDGVEERRAETVKDMAERLAKKFGEEGVRSSVVVPGFIGDADSTGAYEEAKGHMTALMKTERAAPQAVANPDLRLYDIANVTLFLAGDMGENVSGAVVGLDGSYRSLLTDCGYH